MSTYWLRGGGSSGSTGAAGGVKEGGKGGSGADSGARSMSSMDRATPFEKAVLHLQHGLHSSEVRPAAQRHR